MARKAATTTTAPAAPASNDPRVRIWNELTVTDPKFTKNFDRAGFKGTATNPTWIMRRLTEVFGPAGVGWRLVIEDEKYIPGHKLKSGDLTLIHVVRGHLEYRPEQGADWVKTGPQFGQTTMVGENRHGTFTDEEAPKKSLTDCMSKCAVQIGLAADIHLGLWDGNKYINNPVDGPAPPAPFIPQASPPPAPAPVAPAPVVPSPPGVDMATVERSIRGCVTAGALFATFNDLRRFLPLYGDNPAWNLACAWVVETFKGIGDVSSPEAGQIIEALNNERARLDLAGVAA